MFRMRPRGRIIERRWLCLCHRVAARHPFREPNQRPGTIRILQETWVSGVDVCRAVVDGVCAVFCVDEVCSVVLVDEILESRGAARVELALALRDPGVGGGRCVYRGCGLEVGVGCAWWVGAHG